MNWLRYNILAICLAFCFVAASTNELGSTCKRDRECTIGNSRCQSGICTCKSYYAPANATACLDSKLLGHECEVDAQCSLRVANSGCRNGTCQCADGYIRFRRHTCLGPARAGNVCYSNEHCQMWNRNSYCKFIITDLFGTCECEGKENCDDEESIKSAGANSMTDDKNLEAATVEPEGNEEDRNKEKDEGVEAIGDGEDRNTWNADSLPEENAPYADPFSHQKEHLQESMGDLPQSESVLLEGNDSNEATTTVPEMAPATTDTENIEHSSNSDESIPIDSGSKNRENIWKEVEAISLGYACQTDAECQRKDSESKCVEGICDCVVKENGTNFCGKENTGCHEETFQCRSSGLCVSWFFVCDGREDCPDGSDEDCSGPKCPRLSFQCEPNGLCVSQAVLCDGVKNCPNGEDERFCSGQRRNVSEDCPRDTFRCDNGRCLPKFEFCNAIPKCEDGSDEKLELCRSRDFNGNTDGKIGKREKRNCPFECGNGRCRSTAIICSGRDGCGDNSDEKYCSICRCSKIPRIDQSN